MKRKRKAEQDTPVVCQLRDGRVHPFGALRGYVPLGTGEERIYREMREAIPVLDAAVVKMVRLCGGFEVKCRTPEAQQKLNAFLQMMPCGRGQVGNILAVKHLITLFVNKFTLFSHNVVIF